MKVIVDTCVWSQVLRRHHSLNPVITRELENLIVESRVQMIGPIRQELLSGISSIKQYTKLKIDLAEFPDLPIQTEDYELAANFFNLCRKQGIQGSHIDFLICAISHRYQTTIFTTDRDFELFADILEIKLYSF